MGAARGSGPFRGQSVVFKKDGWVLRRAGVRWMVCNKVCLGLVSPSSLFSDDRQSSLDDDTPEIRDNQILFGGSALGR